ncbi:MAG: L,D-transpeptidase family protein [Candidatus Binataceae bacterium]|jgi:murein L,D-transpeptidase YcbB/YkuD
MANARTHTIPAIAAFVAIAAVMAIAAIAPRPALADDGTPIPDATATLTPQGQELQALVNAGALADLHWPNFSDYHGQVTMFYAPGYALAWSDGGKPTPQALAVIEALKHADLKGLDPEDYDASRWDARLAKLAPANATPATPDLVNFDLAMTVCAMRFLSDLSIGRVNPHHVKFGVDLSGEKYDLADFLRLQLIHAADADATIATAEPHYEGYGRAQTALATYAKLAAQGDGTPLPMVQKGIRPGRDYAGVPQLVARLRQLGDLAPEVALPASQTQYAGALVDAVKHFQLRHGLEPDGILGKGTVTDLNTPLSQRVRQIQFALERYRWIPPAFTQPPIIVNLPEFMLRTMRRQPAPFLTMRVVVGKAYRKQTPVFAANMQYIIFRPYWNVPPSIQRAELVPKLRHDRDYLASHGFEVVDGNDVVTDGTVSDEVFRQLREGSLQIRQKPGPKNSLGLVKFIFPNSYNVYLHSTPVPELFSRARRDFSHGCIRVQEPLALALWVLRDNPDWDEEKILAAMNGDQTIQVNLAKPIPVLILYSTAVVEPDGEIRFFDDIYHYDTALQEELAHGYPSPGAGAAAVSGSVNNPSHTATENPY